MKKFEFPLEKALEVRQIKRLLAEEKLGEALRNESLVKSRLDAAYEERESACRDLRKAMSGALDCNTMKHLVRYEESVEDEIFRQRADLRVKRDLTAKARNVAVARTREEKALVRHKENKLREYKAAFWWEQTKVLDEMGTDRFMRAKAR
ncbi:MAG: flagellar FliJ family protein [Bacillota bacterium]